MFCKRNVVGVFVMCVCGVLWAGSASAALALSSIADDLRLRLEGNVAAVTVGGVVLRSPSQVSAFYMLRGYQPAWLNAAGPSTSAEILVNSVGQADLEGLGSQDYHAERLEAALAAFDSGAVHSIQSAADLDLLLTDAFLTYGTHLASGRLDPRSVHGSWTIDRPSKDLTAALQEALARNGIKEALERLSPSFPEYGGLRTALAQYRAIAERGGWPRIDAGPKLEMGMRGTRVNALRARLRVTGDLDEYDARETSPGSSSVASEGSFDGALLAGVGRFQHRHGLEVDGVVGPQTLKALNVSVWERLRQLEVNLERWRWLPDDLGTRYIVVNIPSYELFVVEDGRRVMEARVVVGKSMQQTPVFSATMRYLVLDPYWNIPHKIAVEEMLPQLRRNPYSLFHQNIRVFDTRAGGQEIDPESVDWHAVRAATFHYRLRQNPGNGNALGRIKFMFPNRHSVYLHDTPARHLFARAQRSFSHGCIRLSRPVDLAEYLLKGNPKWSRDVILSSMGTGRERSVPLPESIPIHLLYWTAWVDADGIVHFRNDIYGQDNPLEQALAAL